MTALLSTTSSLAETELARVRRLTADTIRGLAMDAVQKANSGHPGMPMGMADAAVVLWTCFLKHNPADPLWADRDRFILSAGHGSMYQEFGITAEAVAGAARRVLSRIR